MSTTHTGGSRETAHRTQQQEAALASDSLRLEPHRRQEGEYQGEEGEYEGEEYEEGEGEGRDEEELPASPA